MEHLVYVFDSSYYGLLSCVFEAYLKKERPILLSSTPEVQITFQQHIKTIATNEEKAKRVETGFFKTAGAQAVYTATTAWLSSQPDKDTALFYYFCLGFSHGTKINQMLTHDCVQPVLAMREHALGEAHHLKGFLRFRLMENGVYFSTITPKDSVIPLIMPHFSDRYSDQPFVIYDKNHSLAGVYDTNKWEMVEVEGLNLPKEQEEEKEWTALWKQFYQSVEIKQRRNKKLRRAHCPKYFWQNMNEMPENIRFG